MDRMRAAETIRRKSHTTSQPEPKQPKHIRKRKGSEKTPEKTPENAVKNAFSTKNNAPATNNQSAASEGLNDNTLKQAATQLDSLKIRHSPEITEISEDRGPEATDQKQTEKLEWFSTWDDD